MPRLVGAREGLASGAAAPVLYNRPRAFPPPRTRAPRNLMDCPRCELDNPSGTSHCQRCRMPLEIEGERTTTSVPSGWSAQGSDGAAGGPSPPGGALQPGGVLGGRYEILTMLGEGGM